MPARPEMGYNHSAGGWQRGPDLAAEWNVRTGHGEGTYQMVVLPGPRMTVLVGPERLACGQVWPRTALDLGNHALWTSEAPQSFPLGNATAVVVRPGVSPLVFDPGTGTALACPLFILGNGTAVGTDGLQRPPGVEVLEDGRLRVGDGLELAAGQTAQWWGPCPNRDEFGTVSSDCAAFQIVLHLGAWEASRVWFGPSSKLLP